MKNLITRALTGIVFVAVLAGSIGFHPIAYLIVFGVLLFLALREYYALTAGYTALGAVERGLYSLGGVYLFAAAFGYTGNYTDARIFLPYLVFIMYVVIARLYRKTPDPIANWAYIILGQVVLAGPFALMNFIVFDRHVAGAPLYTPLLLLALFVCVWMNDTGAFLVGSLLGKRKLFERISPKKSWEGFYGGLALALAVSSAFPWFMPEVAWYKWMGLAAVTVVFGTWGDLSESLLKRTLHVKDSGCLLPGHGGMLDRFDSVMMAVPAALVYIEWVIRN
ncbi:MAG: phosphatidate cytidylyltransferase [Parabacteroides sp.]|nr:phosphatidate cytidylyltransferase [Parabacteroides sp.]